MRRTKFNLRAGKKCDHTNIDSQAALRLTQHLAIDGSPIRCRFFQIVPDMHPVRTIVGKKNVAFDVVARPVEHHLNLVAGIDVRFSVNQLKLRSRYQAFALPTNVDNHFFVGHTQHMAVQHLALALRALYVVVVQERLIVLCVFYSWCLNIFVR